MSKHKNEKDSLFKIYTDKDVVFDMLHTKFKDEYYNVRPPLSLIIDHIDYIVKLIGIDHVGLGSDFDGVNNCTPQQLEDITGYPQITKALIKRGYSKKDIFKIMGGNFIRLLKENEKSN